MISKKCQSLSYVTWNSTILPLRYGFIAYHPIRTQCNDIILLLLTAKVTVATNAQRKLLHMVLILNTLLISYGIAVIRRGRW